jgi:hypothetical protein
MIIFDTIHRIMAFFFAVVPKRSWWPYAASRLGTFTMAYLGIISATVIGLALFGTAATFGLVIGIIPFAVFLAIRISGALTRNMRYRKELPK